MDESSIQEGQYAWPYHHLVTPLAGPRPPSRGRTLVWGLEYAVYVRHVLSLLHSLQPHRLLDVGCGDGAATRAMAIQHEGAEVVGVDYSERSIAWATAAGFGVPNLQFRATDLTAVTGTFDVVTLIEVLEHIEDPQSFIADAAARTARHGCMVISVPSITQPLHPKHYRHYTLALLENEVRTGAPQMALEQASHVFAPPGWYKSFLRLTTNRFWGLKLDALERAVWNRLWRDHREGDARNARHIVASFRRT